MIMISGFSFTYLLGLSKDNRYFLCGALNASKATSPEEQAANLFSAGSWPWDGRAYLRCWCCSLNLFLEMSPRTHRLAPRTHSGLPLFPCVRKKTSSHKPRHFSSIPSGLRRKNQKVFFMRSRPRLIDWRIDSSCTPSASAISLIDLPRMICASILQPWISGRELRAFHRRRKVSIRSRSSCGVGSCRQAEYSIPSSQSREYCALCREILRW